MAATANRTSVVEAKGCRFLITDRPPSDAAVPEYLKLLQAQKVTDLVRVCDPTYNTDSLKAAGINVHECAFDDGAPPPEKVVDQFLDLVEAVFAKNPKSCIAIHCVAGLGRAPVMVGVALMQRGLKSEDTVLLIREQRRGALNRRQLDYLNCFKPRKNKSASGKKDGGCTIL